ncbi:MAG: tetratricopeptide repeat protein [Terriglobales bacterium]
MKRTAMMFLTVAVASFVSAQQPAPAKQTAPSGQSSTPAQGAAAAPAPQGKRPPQAKTQAEFDAYKAAASATDGPTLEKAADDFAAKFPDSELRRLLYRSAMIAYQNGNNGDKMSEMAEKELKIDPDDPEALIASSEVIAERTRDTDLDKDQRWAEAQKLAEHALETTETDLPAGIPPDKVDAFKGFLRSSAYSVLGTIAFSQEKYPEAEGYFHKSIDAYPAQVDPVVVLRLAIALDKQGRYPDALKEANHAVELTQENTTSGTLARRERDRLVQLTGGSTPAPPAKPSAGTTPAPAPPSH